MRILFAADVVPDPDSGAAGTELQTILALRALGHQVDEIWASDMRRRIRHGNLHYLLELPGEFDRAISRKCQERQYDVIHVNQGHCYRAARRHRSLRRPGVFVCRSHGLDDHMDRVLRQWRRKLGIRNRTRLKAIPGRFLDVMLRRHDRLAYQLSDGIIVSSSIDRDYLVEERGIDPARVAEIPQAPAASFVADAAPPMDAERLPRLLHVGGFAYWKGVHAVAGALNILAGTSLPWTMTWVCRTEEQESVRALLVSDAKARVELLGWMSQDELRSIYDRCGIFISPSLFDGFGKVFLEAMSRGMIVIGTPAGGMVDIIESGKNGVLVPFNDSQAIADTVSSLVQHPHRSAGMSVGAAATAREYSWERVARETAEFYRHLMAREA